MDKFANSALEEWTPINERLMTARFITSHAKVSIVPCYAPTNEHDDADKDAFYQHSRTWSTRSLAMTFLSSWET